MTGVQTRIAYVCDNISRVAVVLTSIICDLLHKLTLTVASRTKPLRRHDAPLLTRPRCRAVIRLLVADNVTRRQSGVRLIPDTK